MKVGYRKPSVKRSISARTTGKVKRAVKSSINPTYGKSGMGYINNPQKAVYNKVYNKTTTPVFSSSGSGSDGDSTQVFGNSPTISRRDFDIQNAAIRLKQLHETADIINHTTNVDTFFSRFRFALDVCDDLKRFEYTGFLKDATPEQQKYEFMKQLPKVINLLITNCYNKAVSKAQELKTEKGKHNRMVHFFEDLISDLNTHGAEYITQTNIDKIKAFAVEAGVDSDITIDLVPVTLELPEVSPAPNPNTAASQKRICPRCENIFINHLNCPDCGDSLILVDNYDRTRDRITADDAAETDKSSTAVGIAALLLSAMNFCIIPLIGFVLWVGGLHFLGFIAFAIYATILIVSYVMGSS